MEEHEYTVHQEKMVDKPPRVRAGNQPLSETKVNDLENLQRATRFRRLLFGLLFQGKRT